MFPKVNSDLSFQCATLGTPSVLTLSFDYPRTQRSPLPARLGEAKVAWMRAGGLWWFFHLLMFTCQVKQPQLYPWRRSSSYPLLAVKLEKHACTRQPHYMLFGCLMRAGWKMENVPSVVCLMAGFLSSNHTAGVPGWSRQHPSAGHCREKNTVFQLASSSSLSPLPAAARPAQHPLCLDGVCSESHRYYGQELHEAGKRLDANSWLIIICWVICWLFFLAEPNLEDGKKELLIATLNKAFESQSFIWWTIKTPNMFHIFYNEIC